MHIAEVSVRRPVASLMFFAAVLMLGFVSLSRLSIDLLPSLHYPKLTIWTQYSNASPQEVESLVSVPVEGALGTISRVKKIESVSREGISLVTIEFLWGTDMDATVFHVRNKLDQLRLTTVLSGISRPTIIRADPSSQPVMSLALSGDNILNLKELADGVIKRRLEQIKGVAVAAVSGGVEREIKVYVKKNIIDNLNISIGEVSGALASANFNLTGGSIKYGMFRYGLRTIGEFTSVRDLEDVSVARLPGGRIVRLKDVAFVEDGFKGKDNITRLGGEESVGVIIYKQAGSNTVKVSNEINKVIGQLREEQPGTKINVIYEEASFITRSIDDVFEQLIRGG